MPRRVKRRRINFKSHFVQDELVMYKSGGKWFLGTVSSIKMRSFGVDYNRIVVCVRGNFVSSQSYHHVYNYGQTHVDQFFFPPETLEDGTLTSVPHQDDRIRNIRLDYPSTMHVNEKWDILHWRENLQLLQSVWFRNGYDTRQRLKCVVVDIKDDKIVIQPMHSKLMLTIDKYSQQIQPEFKVQSLNHGDKKYYVPVRKIQSDYIIQAKMCKHLERKDKYLGCCCTIRNRSDKKGFIVDVDYTAYGERKIYCYIEDDMASNDLPFVRFDIRHMVYVEWITEQEITTLHNVNNKTSLNGETLINGKKTNSITIDWEHDLRQCEIESLFKLKDHDLKLMFYYILRHQKNHCSNPLLFAIAYLMWSHVSYKVQPMYSIGKDTYLLEGLKRIHLRKQDFLELWGADDDSKQQVNQRLNWLLSSTHIDNSPHEIIKAEESYRNVPMFHFEPTDISIINNGKTVRINVDVEYNNLTAFDIITYTATAVNINQIALQPLMKAILPEEKRYSGRDIFNFDKYAQKNVKRMKNDTTDFEKLNKIQTLKKYQSWTVHKMVEEENNSAPLSDIFNYKFNGPMCYNSILGFKKKKDGISNGGFLSLNVGWGKTIIVIELILRQKGSNLICVPVSLLDQWKTELSRFAPSLSISEYYGRKKNHDADVVLTTYGTLRQCVDELKEFDRVIFEESHQIKNPSSLSAQACVKVKAKNRWMVTATPYNENKNHLQTQLRILKIQPFDFNTPLVNNQSVLKKLFKRCVFSLDPGKLKDIGIQPIKTKVKEMKQVNIDSDKDIMLLLKQLKNKVFENTYVNSKLMKSTALAAQIACTHPALFPLSKFASLNVESTQEVTKEQLVKSLESTSNVNAAFKNNVIERLNEENDGTCCICFECYEEPTITPCLHIYCNKCIKSALNHRSKCPQCRQSCTTFQLKKMVTETLQSEDKDNIHYFSDVIGNSYTIPTDVRDAYIRLKDKTPKKFLFLKKYIQETKGSCVIFSQYQLPLMALSKYLSNNNITNGIIVGKTSRKKRGEMINDFADGKLKTFLLTTRTASVGINLQKGSTIIFLEPVLSLSDNIQSIGRLYRIGQTQDINLLQLSTDKTYEFDMINTLKEFKEEEKQINRLYHGREKNRKQSIVKHKLYRHIVVEAV